MLHIHFGHEWHGYEPACKPLQVDKEKSRVEYIHKGNETMNAEPHAQRPPVSKAVNRCPNHYWSKYLSHGIQDKEKGDPGHRYADRGKVDRKDHPQRAYR